MRRLGRVAVAAALMGAVVGVPVAASARLTNSASETNRFTAGSLATPGTPTTIHPNVTGAGDGDVRLTWTDTLPRAVTYLVQRAPVATPTSWTTVNGAGNGQSNATLCTGSVPGAVSCTYDDNAANSTPAPTYNQSYVYRVVSKVGGWTQPSTGRLAESLPPATGSTETYYVPRDLNAVSAQSATAVWAVGPSCTVVFSNGSTWTLQSVPTSACPSGTTLYGVDANAGSPMVVGANGVSFICTAGCTTASPTWAAKATPGSPTLYAVAVQNATNMWAVGPSCTVLYYNGTSWAAQTPSAAACASGTTLYGVAANGGKPIFAGANSTLFTCTGTCNATPSWTVNSPGVPAGTTFYAVDAVTNAWAVGSGGAVAVCTGTCNGAAAVWTTQTSGTTATLRGVNANSTTLIDVVGDSGTVLECTTTCTKNTGVWAAKTSNTTGTLTGAAVPSAAVSIAVGRVGIILNDGGWAPIPTGLSADLNAMSGASATSVWAVGANCTVLHYDGTAWTAQTVGTSFCPAGTTLTGVDADGGKPMIVGANGVTFICKAADCATATPTWTSVSTAGVGSPSLNAVAAAAANQMWAVGANCAVLFYNGTSWAAQTPNTTVCPSGTTLYGVAANGAKPIVGGANATLFTCTGGCTGAGPTWTANSPNGLSGTPTFYAVAASTQAWAVGTGGAIAVCTGTCGGAGATWGVQASGTASTLRAINVSSTTLMDVVGDSGTILQCTTNCTKTSGTWTSQTSNSTSTLTGAYVASTTVAFTVGLGGVGLGLGTGSFATVLVTSVPVDTPTTYSLVSGDLANLGAPDGALYVGHNAWPSTALPTTCSSSTPAVVMTPAPTIPSGSWPISKAVATVVLQVNAVPSGGAGFQLLVSPDGGATWTAYSVTTPTAAATPTQTSVDVTTTIGTTTAVQNARLCLQGSSGSGPALTSSVDLVHLDVN